MLSQHLSRARLTHPNLINSTVQWLCVHGALGSYHDPKLAALPTTEGDLLSIVPLIFGLAPAAAWEQPQRIGYPALRPLIEAHLQRMSVPRTKILVDVLAAICDQYRSTNRRGYVFSNAGKYGLRDVRAQRGMYQKLEKRQNGRCSACGEHLRNVTESLDHIVPWRLGGDPLDGSNWQILCEPCNGGKGSLISMLQHQAAHNWLYGQTISTGGHIGREVRYMALRQTPQCEAHPCTANAESNRLVVSLRDPEGLDVIDNLQVLCDQHYLQPRRRR
ncbi:HNH endonuclease signature motif containing protein [Nonomuraea sp. NPDC049758]|uniref:HNH endonuclease n=1 Tax=Nonomuraea sp. NPDC049758 TaxID=3154360 RepID=UPI0034197BFC